MASTNTDVVIKRMTSLSYEIVSKQFVWGNTLYNNQINNHNLQKNKKKTVGICNLTIQNPEHLKSCLLEGQISNGQVFKWSCFGYGYSPNHLKTGTFKIQTFLSRFQMFFDKMVAINQVLNGWVNRFQIPFKIRTICNPTSFWPLKRVFWISDPHCIKLQRCKWFYLLSSELSREKLICLLVVSTLRKQIFL